MRTLVLLAGLTAMPSQFVAAQTAEPSASDVIGKAEAAYAAVKTYTGATTVKSTSEVGGAKVTMTATAKLNFVRPGKVRIDGKTSSTNGVGGLPFAIVSDGKTTWKSLGSQGGGAFQPVADIPKAGMAGVGLGAAEAIPAALMKSDGAWTGGQNPLDAARLSPPKAAGHEMIDGADCYKLVMKNPQTGDVTLWIDSKTFLLRQMTREMSAAMLADAAKKAQEALQKIGRAAPAGAPAIKSQSLTFSFAIDQVDGPVDAKLFADPTTK